MHAPETKSPLPVPTLSLENIFVEIQDDLDAVEKIIREKVQSKLGPLSPR